METQTTTHDIGQAVVQSRMRLLGLKPGQLSVARQLLMVLEGFDTAYETAAEVYLYHALQACAIPSPLAFARESELLDAAFRCYRLQIATGDLSDREVMIRSTEGYALNFDAMESMCGESYAADGIKIDRTKVTDMFRYGLLQLGAGTPYIDTEGEAILLNCALEECNNIDHLPKRRAARLKILRIYETWMDHLPFEPQGDLETMDVQKSRESKPFEIGRTVMESIMAINRLKV